MSNPRDILSLNAQDRLSLYNTLLGDADALARVGAWEWDTQSHELLWSQGVYDILCLPLETPASWEVLMARLHPDDRAGVQEKIKAAMDTEEAPPMEYRVVLPSGEIRHIRARGKLLRGSGGQARMVGTVTDITHQKERATDLSGGHVRLVEPARGGGGFLMVGERRVRLSLLQFELIKVLLKRYEADAAMSRETRGYVPSRELLVSMSWETAHPNATNLKQNVRRTRTLLRDTGLEVESSRGLGYRLRWRF